jgi:hypothetical protein
MSDARIPAAVLELAHRLAQPRAMRRGWLSVRYLRCNRPGCRCAHRPEAGHGPYTSVVRTVGGRTRSRLVPARLAELLGQQIRAGQEFRKDVEAYWRACEQWADAELEVPAAAAARTAGPA